MTTVLNQHFLLDSSVENKIDGDASSQVLLDSAVNQTSALNSKGNHFETSIKPIQIQGETIISETIACTDQNFAMVSNDSVRTLYSIYSPS